MHVVLAKQSQGESTLASVVR